MKNLATLSLLLLLAALSFSCEDEIIYPEGKKPRPEVESPNPDPIDEEFGEMKSKLKEKLREE